MIKVFSVVGIRPQYIKMSILMGLLDKDKDIEQTIVNTGQHYDYKMAQLFFEELKIPDADYNLEVGSGTHAEQTAKMLLGLEKLMMEKKPDLVLVIGDGNSTLAAALAAEKLQIKVAHIEAGVRSYNRIMPEEINRVLTDHISDILFAPTENAKKILLKEGIEKSRIFVPGDVTADVFSKNILQAEKSAISKSLGLKSKEFILLTLHRAENVDEKNKLRRMLTALSKFDNVVFPIHPRTKKRIDEFGLSNLVDNMKLIEPLGYFDFLNVLKNASVVVTDSGGVQKEAMLAKTPCVTARSETEWVETIEAGANIVVGDDPKKIEDGIKKMRKINMEKLSQVFGDGKASEKIVDIIKTSLISHKNELKI